MSVPFGPLVVTLNDVTPQIRRTFEPFTDPRQGKNTRYTLVDAGLSACSVFFMQSPSLLEYQRRLEQAHGKNKRPNPLCLPPISYALWRKQSVIPAWIAGNQNTGM